MLVARLGLLDPFDKVVGSHVWPISARFGACFWPGEMAFLAIVIFFDYSDVGGDAHGEVGEQRFAGELWIIDAQGTAFRTMNGVAQSAFFGVPFDEEIFGALELSSGDFEPCAAFMFAGEPEFFEPEFVVNFGGYSRFCQATLNGFRLGPVMEEGNGYPIHVTTSSSVLEKQGGIVLAGRTSRNSQTSRMGLQFGAGLERVGGKDDCGREEYYD